MLIRSVMAYYDEDVARASESMAYIAASIPMGARVKRIVYLKGMADGPKRMALRGMADQVVDLVNVGREGETYLVRFLQCPSQALLKEQNHIVRNYPASLADYTIFVQASFSVSIPVSQLTRQPHIAWEWVMKPRLAQLASTPNIGFLSFGPYINQTCGKDSSGNEFPRMADIYSMFRQDLCPPRSVLVSRATPGHLGRAAYQSGYLGRPVHRLAEKNPAEHAGGVPEPKGQISCSARTLDMARRMGEQCAFQPNLG